MSHATDRYACMFRAAAGRPVLVPFVMLGFPDAERSLAACEALIGAGADALELGLPFNAAVADGEVIQDAARVALGHGITVARCLALIAELRARHPRLPLGLLTYANLVEARGVDAAAQAFAVAGLDSVLIADLPVAESAAWRGAARMSGLAPVFIAPPNAPPETLDAIARHAAGYTYLAGRAGVTGTHAAMQTAVLDLVPGLVCRGAPPCLLGFGVSSAAQVADAFRGGAAGAIVGSHLVARLAAAPGSPEMLGPALRALRPGRGALAGGGVRC